MLSKTSDCRIEHLALFTYQHSYKHKLRALSVVVAGESRYRYSNSLSMFEFPIIRSLLPVNVGLILPRESNIHLGGKRTFNGNAVSFYCNDL